jgi:glucuronokinase
MRYWADLTDQARACLERGDAARLAALMNANFDRRAQLYRLSAGNLRMVAVARAAGASAKFSGSGGAIVGTYPDEAVYARLERDLAACQVAVFKPRIV